MVLNKKEFRNLKEDKGGNTYIKVTTANNLSIEVEAETTFDCYCMFNKIIEQIDPYVMFKVKEVPITVPKEQTSTNKKDMGVV